MILLILGSIVMIFLLFKKKTASDELIINLSRESVGITLVRSQEEIEDPFAEKILVKDLIQVDDSGELWLDLENNSRLFAAGNTHISLKEKSKFKMYKGQISGKIESQNIMVQTQDCELKTSGAQFKVSSSKEGSKVTVIKGLVELLRLNDGKSITIPSGKSVNSVDLELKPLAPNELTIFPARENGVVYQYYPLSKDLISFNKDKLIDNGIVNSLNIKRGDHEGYVRRAPDSHSHVAHSNFSMVLKSFLNIAEPGAYTFRLSGSTKAIFFINGQKISLGDKGGKQEVTSKLKNGFIPLQINAWGILEKDSQEYALRLQYKKSDAKEFRDIPEEALYYSNNYPIKRIMEDGNINSGMSAHLPLNGKFTDVLNSQEAKPEGSPQFVEDEKAGLVCRFDGKKDYLIHLPVDQLGMVRDYTATCWIKLEEGAHYDQVLFANSPGENNATLVLLIRRLHPYQAHLHNDTIANERLEFGKWAHVAFRYHAGQQSIFLNGKLAVSSNNHSSLFSNRSLIIGMWQNRFMKGLMREIRIYNTALHRDDITEIYKKTLR